MTSVETPVARGVGSAPLRYLLLVGGPVLGILAVLHAGAGRAAAPAAPTLPAHAPAAGTADIGLLLLQLLVVLLATRLCGLAVRPFGQPHVVGEMLAGVLPRPSFLGLVAPGLAARPFPPARLRVLDALS